MNCCELTVESFLPIPSVIWRKLHLSGLRIVELLLPSMYENEWLIPFWMMSTLEDFFQAFILSNPYHFYTKKKKNRKKISVCYLNLSWFSMSAICTVILYRFKKTNTYYKFNWEQGSVIICIYKKKILLIIIMFFLFLILSLLAVIFLIRNHSDGNLFTKCALISYDNK